MSGLFRRGYKGVREEQQHQEEEKAKRQNQLFRFFLTGNNDEAQVRFLTEEPVGFYEHSHKIMRNGKETYSTNVCMGNGCPDCEEGDRPVYKGAYLIVDHREYKYKDATTGKEKKGKDQVRLFIQGVKVLSQLDRLSERYGITNRDLTIIRLGTGNQTSYTIDRGEEDKLSSKEIEALLPDKLRDKFDGTMDSLYDIIEEQLQMNMASASSHETEDDGDAPSEKEVRRNLVNTEEEDEPASRKGTLFKGSSGKSNNPVSSKPSLVSKVKTQTSSSGLKPLGSKPTNSGKPALSATNKGKSLLRR